MGQSGSQERHGSQEGHVEQPSADGQPLLLGESLPEAVQDVRQKVVDHAAFSEHPGRTCHITLWNAMMALQDASLALFLFAGRGSLKNVATSSTSGRESSIRVFQIAEALNIDLMSFSGCIFICGGTDLHSELLNSVEIFNPNWNSWHNIQAMSTKRCGAAAAAVGDTSMSVVARMLRAS